MEKWRMIEKNGILFNVSNKGNVQVLDCKRGKYIKLLEKVGDFSLIGGQPNKRYLSTHGVYIHILVAETWIGPIPKGYTVNHKDLNKFNNDVENLEIITQSENIKHSYESGARDSQMLSEHEIERRRTMNEMKKMNNQWIVYDTNFNVLRRYDSHEDASRSIGVSRQAANASFRKGRALLKRFYICKSTQLDELKERIGGN
ncbi:HNH endonuclease [Bacillus cereus]|nr:HNH endonuclease [Bacillus cereus]